MNLLAYNAAMKQEWDAFVDCSKNGTFLLKRNYMEYHADRFKDCSFVFTDDTGAILALLPANRNNDVLYSHQGLTYGGLILSDKTSGSDPLAMFELLKRELPKLGISKMIYKAIPHIYHRQPSEEDLYALFRNSATLKIRNLATVINMREPMKSSRLGKRALKRQRQNGIEVREIDSSTLFWDIVIKDRKERHNVKPVHTASELDYLKSKFPENIRFYIATAPDELIEKKDENPLCDSEGSCRKIVGGAVIYIDKGVIHLQYAACTQEGKDLYATDVIYHRLIFDIFSDAHCFDFGISNENAGLYLNEGMVRHKEEFGGRSVVYDIYELDF